MSSRLPIVAIHDAVDAAVARLARVHADRLRCGRGCSMCCVDNLTVYEVEADRIVASHAAFLQTAEPRAPGMCAFLDAEGACRVYAERPYVCRTQGLPLRWYEEDDEGEIVESRDICELNLEGAPLDALDEEDCFQLGHVEEQLMALQAAADGGEMRRVALRDLFLKSTSR